MERPKKQSRCQKSIAAILIFLALHFVLTHAAAAAQPADQQSDMIAHVDRDVAGDFGTSKSAPKPSAQQDIPIEDEVLCLALNIYFEARSESEQGQLAVAHVVMNRAADRKYPSTVCGVVRQGGEERLNRCQFSWWCDGKSDRPLNQKAWLKSLELAITVYFEHAEDPTGGALWYHADYVSPYWRDKLVVGSKIGQHIFYLEKKQPKYAFN